MSLHPRSVIAAALLTASFGCVVSMNVPDDVPIDCSDEDDCPPSMVCTAAGRCAAERVNLPPAVTASVRDARPLAQVVLEVSLSDLNGPPFGDDSASLAASFDAGGGPQPGTLLDAADALEASNEGTAHTITWDARADAGSVTVPTYEGDTPPFGVEPASTEVVGYEAMVRLVLTATDDGSPALASTPFETPPFAVGNNPPAVVLTIEERDVAGEARLDFILTDDAGDVATIEIQFRLDGEWRRAAISLGDLEELAPRGASYSVLWDTFAAPDADPTAGQGVGAQNVTGVSVRARGRDQPNPGVHHFGAWHELGDFSITNQTPPRVEGLRVLNAPIVNATGGMVITYRLVDDQSDRVDVAVEYSVDAGERWVTCAELPVPISEGMGELASAPTSYEGDSGIPHLFVWDTLADLHGVNQPVELRVRSADAGGVGLSAELALGIGVGRQVTIDVNNADWDVRSDTDVGAMRGLMIGRFAGPDTIPDVAGLAGMVSDTLRVVSIADLNGGPGDDQMVALGLGVGTAVAADFNGDDFDDVAITGFDGVNGFVDVYLSDGSATPFSVASHTALPPAGGAAGLSPFAGVLAADFDGDGDVDLATHVGDEVWLLPGNGDGTFVVDLANQTVTLPYEMLLKRAGDLDGDGFPELIAQRHPAEVSAFPPMLHIMAGQPRVAATDRLVADPVDRLVPLDRFVLHDLDRDGLLDIAGSEIEPAALWVYRAVPSSDPIPDYEGIHIDTATEFLERLVAADIDGDGWTDITAASALRLYTWFGTGDERVLQPHPGIASVAMRGCFNEPLAFSIEDFDTDGIAEWVVASTPCAAGGGSIQRSLRVVTPVIAPPPPAGELSNDLRRILDMDTPSLLTSMDFDADGIPDLLAADARRAVAMLGNGELGVGSGISGPSSTVHLISPVTDFSFAGFVLPADVNGDGAIDLALTPLDGGEVWVALGELEGGRPTGSFGVPSFAGDNYPVGAQLYAVGDIDADGLDDLILGAPLRVLLADGSPGAWSGSFTVIDPGVGPTAVPPVSLLVSVLPAHLDADGHLDLVVVGVPPASIATFVAVLLGDGAGGLDPVCTPVSCGVPECNHPLELAPAQPRPATTAQLADIDRDGDLDLFMGISQLVPDAGDVVALLRNAPGACELFSTEFSLHPAVGLPADIEVVDYDRDGTLDVLLTSGEPAVMLGDPNVAGALANPIDLRTEVSVSRLAWVDLNHDGIEDLASVDALDLTLAVAHRERHSYLERWSSPLRTWSGDDDDDGSLWGLSETRTHLLLGDLPERAMQRRTVGDLLADAYAAGVGTAQLAALTDAWEVAGAMRLAHELDGGARVHVRADERLALDLSATPPAGVVIDLPLRREAIGADLSAADIRVFVRASSWVPASDIAADVSADPDPDALPSVWNAEGDLETLYVPRTELIEVLPASGALRDAVEPRFIVDASNPMAPRVRVLTDRLGVAQAFVVGGLP